MNFFGTAFTAAASLVGLGLIGTGAQAICAHPRPGGQIFYPGEQRVVLSSPAVRGCTSPVERCSSLVLPTAGPVGSRFDTAPIPVTVTNTGDVAVGATSLELTANSPAGRSASAYLRDEMNVCISSDGTVVANGPLTRGLSLSPSVALAGLTLKADGGTYEYGVDFYAGENSAACKTDWSDSPHTASAWSGATYPAVNPWVTPASLAPAAERGAVSVTVSISYIAAEGTHPILWKRGSETKASGCKHASSPASKGTFAPVVGTKGSSTG